MLIPAISAVRRTLQDPKEYMATRGSLWYAPGMESISQPLPPEIEAAVAREHGGPVTVSGQEGRRYVVIDIDVYGDGISRGTAAEYADSLAAVKRSMAQHDSGEQRPVHEFFGELERKHEA